MKRIMIIGGSGSGKSTLAGLLSKKLGISIIHGDKFQFMPGWQMRSQPDRDALFLEAIKQECWIIDGNYSATWQQRIERADTIIFLDISRYLRVWRILWRSIRYHGRTRPDMPEGCPERFDWDFVKWTWDYDKRGRNAALKALEEASKTKKVLIFRSRKEVGRWLSGVATISR